MVGREAKEGTYPISIEAKYYEKVRKYLERENVREKGKISWRKLRGGAPGPGERDWRGGEGQERRFKEKMLMEGNFSQRSWKNASAENGKFALN